MCGIFHPLPRSPATYNFKYISVLCLDNEQAVALICVYIGNFYFITVVKQIKKFVSKVIQLHCAFPFRDYIVYQLILYSLLESIAMLLCDVV